ncbi:hypothetical protein R1sor_022794 [Riccia sorocarpa]|uniref:Reverse transcriptase domain-containing protein n=1 Tax=Riccia sorocarpa TaxID=122646 RepID=A0ABD3GLN0_9MARC
MLKSKFKREAIESLTTEQGEVLTERKDILAETQRDMIVAFWRDSRLTVKTLKGVIKLIPKKDDKSRLRDWLPISLLGITYKIISKLLAERLKPMLPGLVNDQQIGFVPGRSIFDVILVVKLGQEWAQTTGQKRIFLKLDFVKAYDRVNHNYVWRVLDTMGFGSQFITLLKGLVENATSVVHLNGAFTRDVQLERGVRQGCPIAPMLFTLSTQPLMELLRSEQIKGHLHGLEARNGRQVLDALFADDTGLMLHADAENWKRATEVIQKFEVMSGARLNVSKSLAVPIGFTEPPGVAEKVGL